MYKSQLKKFNFYKNGATGNGISSITRQYYLSTSKYEPINGEWKDEPYNWEKNKYLWIRDAIKYTNGDTVYTTPYCDNSWEAVNDVEAQILAWCHSNDATYIDGSKIYTHSISANQLSTDAIKSLNYTKDTAGSFLNLADGSFDSKHLKWTKEGVITATSGKIGDISIDTDGIRSNDGEAEIKLWNNGKIVSYRIYDDIPYPVSEYSYLHEGTVGLAYEPTNAPQGSSKLSLTPRGIYHYGKSINDGYTDFLNTCNSIYFRNHELHGYNGILITTDELEVNGDLSVTGVLYTASGTVSASDRNVKKDFKKFDDSYEKLFFDLKPQLYRFKNGNSNRLHSGFIAQDVEESLEKCGLGVLDFGGFCKTNKDGEFAYKYGLRYEEFIALNTHMIQKLQKRIVELEKQIETLKT